MLLQEVSRSALALSSVPRALITDLMIQQQYEDDEPYFRQSPTGLPRRNRNNRSMTSEFIQNQKQIGAGLISFGLILTLLSMMMLFNANLLRIGNLSLIAGSVLLIGPHNFSAFFLKESRMQATIITAIGIILVFFGRPRLGLIVEIFGIMNLFGNMFPIIFTLLKTLPGVSDFLEALFGTNVNNQYKGNGYRMDGRRESSNYKRSSNNDKFGGDNGGGWRGGASSYSYSHYPEF